MARRRVVKERARLIEAMRKQDAISPIEGLFLMVRRRVVKERARLIEAMRMLQLKCPKRSY